MSVSAAEIGTEHNPLVPALPAKSTYVTEFQNLRHFHEEHEKAWAENMRKNKNDNGEYSEETGEVVPEVHTCPLHEGDPNSPFITQLGPDEPFKAISFVYGNGPAPWIDSTSGILITSGVSSCVEVRLMGISSNGREGRQSMAHFYMRNGGTEENIIAKTKELRGLGYTHDSIAVLVGAWHRKEYYERDARDTGEGEITLVTPEYLAAVCKHADDIVKVVSRLGFKVVDLTRGNRPPYEHSNRYSNIASRAERDKDGRLQFPVFPDARFSPRPEDVSDMTRGPSRRYAG